MKSPLQTAPTVGWTSDAYGTQNWKHFRSFEVVARLVKLYRISGRYMSHSLMFCLEIKMPWCQNPSWRRKKTSCGDISTALNMTRHKIKSDWLLYLSVKWLLGRASDIQSGQGCQSFCNQSEGLATWDYIVFSNNEYPRWKKTFSCCCTFENLFENHIWKSFCFLISTRILNNCFQHWYISWTLKSTY